MTPVEALAKIRDLCDRADLQWAGHVGALRTTIPVSQVRAILDAVSADATPAQGIDREVLMRAAQRALRDHVPSTAMLDLPYRIADYVLALVRPVEGVVLTPEEAALALPYIERAIETYPWEDDGPLRALAARLEVSR